MGTLSATSHQCQYQFRVWHISHLVQKRRGGTTTVTHRIRNSVRVCCHNETMISFAASWTRYDFIVIDFYCKRINEWMRRRACVLLARNSRVRRARIFSLRCNTPYNSLDPFSWVLKKCGQTRKCCPNSRWMRPNSSECPRSFHLNFREMCACANEIKFHIFDKFVRQHWQVHVEYVVVRSSLWGMRNEACVPGEAEENACKLRFRITPSIVGSHTFGVQNWYLYLLF